MKRMRIRVGEQRAILPNVKQSVQERLPRFLMSVSDASASNGMSNGVSSAVLPDFHSASGGAKIAAECQG